MEFLRSIVQPVTDLLFPHLCGGCGVQYTSRETILCVRCLAAIEPVFSIDYTITQKYELTVSAVGTYTGPLVRLVLGKARSDRAAATELGELMARALMQFPLQPDFLVPVPMHWSRRVWRGYDQGLLIAERMSSITTIPVLSALTKKKRTPFQSAVAGTERAQNCRDAFELIPDGKHMLAGKRVMLIDDVSTTGATLIECARVIVPARPLTLQAFVGARTVQG